MLAFFSMLIADWRLTKSWLSSLPVRSLFWPIWPSEENRRRTSCRSDISIENTATGTLLLIAAAAAMFIEKEVL